MSSVRLVEGVQLKLVPVCPEVMVSTVFKSVAMPFFKRIVTGPEASLQVMFTGVPAVIPTNDCGGMVNWAAFARVNAAEATTAIENCILIWFEGS